MQQVIRPATQADASTITELSYQLGYKISIEDTLANIATISNSGSDIIRVATINDVVVGWIQVSCLVRLESGIFCEIVGLVVDEKFRGRGIGPQLLNVAKEWCKQKRCNKLKVRSNVVRIGTHCFYTNAGFKEVKEQKVFEIEKLIYFFFLHSL